MTDKGKKKQAPPRPGDRVIEAEFFAGATSAPLFPPPTLSEIAFAGRSNVGKSSLMNCLTERNGLVRTSSTPGCTRQISWFRAVSDDKAEINLVDLPGYGYAKRSKTERKEWAGLIDAYLLERPTLKAVVLLVDVRRGHEEDDLELIKMLEDTPRVSRRALQIILVATKLDKLPLNRHKPVLQQLTKAAGHPVLGFSASTGLGRVALWRKVRSAANIENFEDATLAGVKEDKHLADESAQDVTP